MLLGGYKELAAVVIKLAVMSPEERNVCNGFEGLSVTSRSLAVRLNSAVEGWLVEIAGPISNRLEKIKR